MFKHKSHSLKYTKEQPREKNWTIPFLLESPRNKEFQPPDLEIDFLIDSGAESNIINIPTWNENKKKHTKLKPLATSSKLATAQGSTLVNYGKIQLFLLPTRTMEQKKILNKPIKQIFVLLILSTISLAYHLYQNIYH